MAEITEFSGSTHGDAEAMLNAIAGILRQARRPWGTPFDGDHCMHLGVDYDYTGSGPRNTEPGTADGAASWQAVDRTVTTGPTPAGALIVSRGLKADLEALPGGHTIDLFIVEKEPIAADGTDWNGRYWKTWIPSEGAYGMLK